MAVPERTLGALKLHMRESLVARTLQLPVQEFIHTQGVSSAFLLIAAVVALAWANSPWSDSYHHAWHIQITLSGLSLPVHAWINDAMMALFFFLMGMEIKREIIDGELSDLRRAALPVFAGLGGMVAPALIYLVLNFGRASSHGWGIPMATDIAFSLGVLALIPRVPQELKIFLLSLAIADDIGAIAVIAVFYTDTLHFEYLLLAASLIGVILVCRKIGISRPILYAALGFVVWFSVLRSGVHATIAGVILGLLVPVRSRVSLDAFRDLGMETMAEFREAHAAGDTARANRVLGALEYLVWQTESPADRVTRKLLDWIAYLVLPLFALANAGVTFSAGTWSALLHSPVTWGVAIGLFLGKPLGILTACWLTVKLGITRLPNSVTWRQIAGVAVLAGIGFTVSLFVAGLAFEDQAHLDAAKASVLLTSLIAGVAGYLLLRRAMPKVPRLAGTQPKG